MPENKPGMPVLPQQGDDQPADRTKATDSAQLQGEFFFTRKPRRSSPDTDTLMTLSG